MDLSWVNGCTSDSIEHQNGYLPLAVVEFSEKQITLHVGMDGYQSGTIVSLLAM